MHDAIPRLQPDAPRCTDSMEELLNLYVDGELSFAQQPALFAHLAACAPCRRTLDSVLRFRRISRQEHLAVPPAVDDEFMKRLAERRHMSRGADREVARRPLWQARTPVSLRVAVAAAVLVFLTGLLLPLSQQPVQAARLVIGQQEQVELAAYRDADAVYVFYPGLTVEAAPDDEPALESL